MSGVKLVNETGHDLILEEGSGGIFTPRGTIRRGQVYLLRVDTNATYREYLCKLSHETSQKGQGVEFNSDDFADYEQVTIKWDQTKDELSYEAKKRESRSNAAAAAAKSSGQANPGFSRRLLNKFGWKKRQTPTDGGGGGGGSGGGGGGGGSGDADVPRHGGAPKSWEKMLSDV